MSVGIGNRPVEVPLAERVVEVISGFNRAGREPTTGQIAFALRIKPKSPARRDLEAALRALRIARVISYEMRPNLEWRLTEPR